MSFMTNNMGISLPLAVWLARDEYDYDPTNASISATALLKPIRQILLNERLEDDQKKVPDVADYIASRMGTAIHDSVERAWLANPQKAMKLLGYPEEIAESVVVNPKDPNVNGIKVYLEQRGEREIMGYRIRGKFDLVVDGELHDIKSTSTYAYTHGTKDQDYILQGSIYRWIHRDKITSDFINIEFVFTDWQKFRVGVEKNYPETRILPYRLPLMSLEETEAWIVNKLKALEANVRKKEPQLPRCTKEELWMDDTVYKYYSNPDAKKATKNFDTDKAGAYKHLSEKGKGVVRAIPGKPKACGYCAVFNICTQKDEYEHD